MKCIRQANEERHQHNDTDQQHRWQGVKIGFGGEHRAAPSHLPLTCFSLALVRYATHCLFMSSGESCPSNACWLVLTTSESAKYAKPGKLVGMSVGTSLGSESS